MAVKEKTNDNAKEMLLRNSADVLRAFMECSDEMQRGVLEMVQILDDAEADEDQKAAAGDTLIEVLYPQYHGDELGMDLCDYDKLMRKGDAHTEAALDAEEATFAEVLTRLMDERSMTQKQLADKVGVGQPAIANMLGRECRPQRRTIEKIASALDVDPKTLWPFSE